MAARLTLRKFVSPEYVYRDGNGIEILAWPLRIEATGIDIPSEVFVYQRVLPDSPVPGDVFSCLASITQLVELPRTTGFTVEDGQVPFYLRSSVEVFCERAEDVQKFWERTVSRAEALVRAWNSRETLYNTTEAIVTADAATEQVPMITPINLTLSYHPAGTVAVVGGYPEIDTPDSSIRGWLPIEQYAGSAPEGAKLFYNFGQHPEFKAALERVHPAKLQDSLMFFYSGEKIPYGRSWSAASDTIFWLDTEDLLPKGPWPVDYIDADNPGTGAETLQLTIFPEA